ncbi:MAG: cation-transporting P-type ATPase [Bacteroidales bacterium]
MKKGNGSGSEKNARKPEKSRWHSMSVEEVVRSLEADGENGLDEKEAEKRLETYGPNEMPGKRQRTWWQRLLAQFTNVLIYVLIGAAVITALMDHWVDTWVILAVVLINAVIGFIQEGKAESALENIQQMLSMEATVLRGGQKKTIDAVDLVPGDLVMVKAGDKVPADMRLLKSKDLRVEESPLTGESSAVEKNTEAVEEDAIVGDQFSMVFSGTVVTYGKATGVVVGTGEETEIGKINKMMSEVEEITTPLLQKIDRFGKYLSLVILGVTALFFLYGYLFADYEVYELLMAVIALIVASIPEGLPAIMTITLAIGVQKMADRNAIIRRLPSVETLGAVDVICSDKTGTLTRNEMTARQIITAEQTYTIEGRGYKPEGDILLDDKAVEPENDKVLWQLLQAARVCNNAEVNKDEDGTWKLTGTPTEGALLVAAYKAGLKDLKPERIDSIPFESDHKYMATLNQVGDKRFIFVTGAPERVMDLCTRQYTQEGAKELDLAFWEEKMEEAAGKGQRLLGIAFNETGSDRQELNKDEIEYKKIFLGVIGIIDPPRKEVIDAIRECREAGITVKMITGDHAATARSIGKEIGIGDGEKSISGKELEKASDGDLRKFVREYDVYARTSPEHKLRLVKAIQANNSLCAMTGDGVNDAPALKKANIGIAMGIKGTGVSRDASEMVLADDNFASIVNAVEEGRTVYDNIRKSLLFILPTNGAEMLALMSAVLLGVIMPVTPLQILWVNMVTAITLALALAFEPMEQKVMERPPRSPQEPILGKMFIWRIGFVSVMIGGMTLGIFSYMHHTVGAGEEVARTVAVNTLVAGQLFYLFNCRKIKAPVFGKGFFDNSFFLLLPGPWSCYRYCLFTFLLCKPFLIPLP